MSVRARGEDAPVAVPVIIFVGCIAAGVWASSRWLPALAEGSVGGVSFFAVCGLLGAALAVCGLRTYDLIETVSQGGFGDTRRDLLASGLASILWETGLLVALAFAVYLLAPRPDGAAGRVGAETPRPPIG